MEHASLDDRRSRRPRSGDGRAHQIPSDGQVELTVVTEVDLTSHSLPISRVRWRPAVASEVD